MKPIYINFAAPEKRHHKKTVALTAALLIFSICLTINNIYTFHVQQNAIVQYKNKIDTLSSEDKTKNKESSSKAITDLNEKQDSISNGRERFSPSEMEALKANVYFLNRLLSYRAFPWIDTLNKIESSIDDGIKFNYIDIERDSRKITLKGAAESAENLSSFIKAVSLDKLFLLNFISQESKQEEAINFDMGLTIRQ